MALLCWKWLKNLTNGVNVGNEVYMFDMAQEFEKRLKYVGNDVDLWEMDKICGK